MKKKETKLGFQHGNYTRSLTCPLLHKNLKTSCKTSNKLIN